MAQGLVQVPVTGTVSGLQMAGNINVGLVAVASLNSGATAPTTTNTGLASIANLFWVDTGNNVIKKRDNADAAWITFAQRDFNSMQLSDGNAASPAYAFSSDTSMGWYRSAANHLAGAVNGVKVVDVGAGNMTVTGNVQAGGSFVNVTGSVIKVKQNADTSGFYGIGIQSAANDSTLGLGYNNAANSFDITASYSGTGNYKAVRILTSDVLAMTVAVNGGVTCNIGIGVGNATAGAGGIAFPATAVAVADANTLDDYEEGTYTAVIKFGGGVGTGQTYSFQTCNYTKIGNRVFIAGLTAFTNKGNATGVATYTGLPFTAASGAGNRSNIGIYCLAMTLSGSIQSYTTESTTTAVLDQQTLGVNANLADTAFSNTSQILVGGHYII